MLLSILSFRFTKIIPESLEQAEYNFQFYLLDSTSNMITLISAFVLAFQFYLLDSSAKRAFLVYVARDNFQFYLLDSVPIKRFSVYKCSHLHLSILSFRFLAQSNITIGDTTVPVFQFYLLDSTI